MKPAQKVLTTVLWALTVLAMVGMIGAGLWKGRDREGDGVVTGPVEVTNDRLAVLGQVPAFSLIDQNSKSLTLESLRGKPWIATFVFTRCAGPCPVMTAKMGVLQKSLPANVDLVSVSVDPTNDTPSVLKEYAAKYAADESRWHFLTGDPDAIYAFARGMMITAVPATQEKPIIHSERFILVGPDGDIRGYYSNNDEKEMANLKLDAETLAAQAPAPQTPAQQTPANQTSAPQTSAEVQP
jgi:cytochrome oxidase Cu insertion factor (SCO1/SenC/PrrC family)